MFIPFHFREAAANVLTIDETRSGREDPGVQVLRGADRARHERERLRGSALMSVTNGRVPGREARAGKFPGPSLIPVAQRDPTRARLAAPRGAHPARPATRAGRCTRSTGWSRSIRTSARRRRRRSRSRSAATCRAGCTAPMIRSPRSTSATATGLRSRSARSRASGVATSPPPRPSTSGRFGPPTFRAGAGRPRGDDEAGGRREDAAANWPNDPYAGADPGERYATVKAMLAGEFAPEEAIQTIKDSGLRGMGGAGFPTGSKWEIVAKQTAEPKYVICNADESEPGTFKDRQILAEQPHLVIEAMLAGMIVIGAEQGWVFIRHEYGPEEAEIRAELDAARAAGLLGEDVLGSGRNLDIDVFTSPGGYILGEESALIECMEGHRGEPRNKPPFPGTNGLWGKPTLMNSVETFAASRSSCSAARSGGRTRACAAAPG